MYSAAILLSATTTASTAALPYFHLGGMNLGPLPIQWFGVIVAVGVLIGASILRRYAEWHGVGDDQIRSLTGWVTVSGFLGAHWFDAIFYEWDRLSEDPLLFFKLWDGISSYGGFVGGAIGFTLFIWWKRLPAGLMADITGVGLLPAFSIGRIGCTVVSDHIGAAADPSKWYAFLAMEYPTKVVNNEAVLGPIKALVAKHPGHVGDTILAWNLGLIELLYLIPVNLLVLWIAFRPSRRMPAGFLGVLIGILYAPVRFFLDYLRPDMTDPRYFGFTFAQWCSIIVFGVALYAASRLIKHGKAAEPITRTAREAQDRLKIALKSSEDQAEKDKDARKTVVVAKPDLEVAKKDVVTKDEETEAEVKAATAAVEDPKVDAIAEVKAAAATSASDDEAAKQSPDEIATIKPGDRKPGAAQKPKKK